MSFVDATHGWVAGYDEVRSTTDGGVTWTRRELTSFYDILSISFVSRQVGFIAPNSVTIGVQVTRDGGSTWTSCLSEYTNDLDYTDANTIYTLKTNGTVLKSTNQGSSWNSIGAGLSSGMKGINFVNATTGFAWSGNGLNGKVYRTTNAGLLWSLVYDNPMVDINSVILTPGGRYLAVGTGGMIISSTNATSWSIVHAGAIGGALRRVDFTGNLNGFAAGDRGSLIRTVDGGINWTPVDLGTREDLAGLDFVDARTGFLAGDGNVLFKTVNGGDTWQQSNSGLVAPDLWQLDAWDANRVYAGCNNGVFMTTNGGTTWTQTAHTGIAYTLFLTGPQTILAGGISQFLFSTNSGSTWSNKPTPRTFFSMFFKTAEQGFIGDHWGRVQKTTDQGATWQQVYNCGKAIWDMTFINDTVGYFVADQGFIGKTIDGGNNWFQAESGTVRDLRGISFTPDGTGFIVGQDGIILRKAAIPTYTIEFQVTSSGGQPINDAVVSINDAPYPAGTYTIQGLIAGSYTYKVSGAGYLSVAGTIELTDDELIPVILEPGLDAPVALPATEVTGSGFVANWEGVIAADSYLLYVSADGFVTHISGYNGVEVNGLSQEVTGINPAIDHQYRLKCVSMFGESAYSNTIIVPASTGIETPEVEPVNVYPNPASDWLRIETGNRTPARIELFDAFGRLVMAHSSVQASGTGYSLDIRQLSPGAYRMRLVCGKQVIIKSILVR
jgi:photosystem II stability/assembly factor-like uncharacterized protein